MVAFVTVIGLATIAICQAWKDGQIVKNPLRNPIPRNPLVKQAIEELSPRFNEIDLQTMSNMNLILQLFKDEKVDATAFHGVNGYGYGDFGRESFDNIIAKLLGAEKALVRIQFFSGTHAISTALFACLRPGDEWLSVSGQPYDTLEEVIGLRPNQQTGGIIGSLKDWKIQYHQLELIVDQETSSVKFNLPKIKEMIDNNPKLKLVHIQRSCGYQWRPSIPISEIEVLSQFIEKEYKSKGRDLVLFCDNCYGELVEEREPCHVGVDLIAGSLIKNLGGTLAPCGGYVAGKEKYVNAAAVHLSAPGVEGGATLNQYRHIFQGLFMAPSIIGESLKGAELLSTVLGKFLKYPCNPPPQTHRTDIIQAIQVGNRKKVRKCHYQYLIFICL